jgi:hypothetical protein
MVFASTGVEHPAGGAFLGGFVGVLDGDADAAFDRRDGANRGGLFDLGAELARVVEEEGVELRAVDLERLVEAGHKTFGEDDLFRGETVGEMEEGARFFDETSALNLRPGAGFAHDLVAVREE